MSADPTAVMAATDEAVTPAKAPATPRGIPTLLLLNIATVVLGIALWWTLSLIGLQIPGPPEVLLKGIELATSGILLQDVAASLLRVFKIGRASCRERV